MHFANFTYAHSVCFYLPVVSKNVRKEVRIGLFLQLEGCIFAAKCIFPQLEGNSFSTNWHFPGAETYIFCVFRFLPHVEAHVFSKKWPLRSAEAHVFLKKWPLLQLSIVPLLLVFWLFLGVLGLLFEKNSSGTITQYFIKPPGIFPKWNTPGTKI